MKSTLDLNYSMFPKSNALEQEKFYSMLSKRGIFSSKLKYFEIPKPSKRMSRICGLFWSFRERKRQYIESQLNRYIYRLDLIAPLPVRKRKSRRVVHNYLVRLFYIIFTPRQFKRLAKKASKRPGLFKENYLCLLEGRLCTVAYRAGFFGTLFEALLFTRNGTMWVDGKYIKSIYYSIKPLQILGFNPVYKGTIFWSLLRRLNRRLILTNCPNYMYISYTFLFFFWKRVPGEVELINPVSVDMLRLCGYCT